MVVGHPYQPSTVLHFSPNLELLPTVTNKKKTMTNRKQQPTSI
nr:MAG TPA: hypothetical protein [Caudoviricetes sp.]